MGNVLPSDAGDSFRSAFNWDSLCETDFLLSRSEMFKLTNTI